MELKVVGSSSNGNCYILRNKEECLVIEVGFEFKKISKALDFNIRNVKAFIVSHNHGDHARGIKGAIDTGLPVVVSSGTAIATGIDKESNCKIIKHGETMSFGNFQVMAFDVKHDAEEPIGFLIRHPETGLICFITDSFYVPYKFPNVNHFIVEANYKSDFLDKNYENGILDEKTYNRTKSSHMSIDTCIDFLLANDLSEVVSIILIHLSPRNSNSDEFKTRVIEETGCTTYIARPNLVINNFELNLF